MGHVVEIRYDVNRCVHEVYQDGRLVLLIKDIDLLIHGPGLLTKFVDLPGYEKAHVIEEQIW